MSETLKEQVVAVAGEMERLGMCRYRSGNLSIPDPETGYVVIMLNGVARDILGTGCVYVMDLWGRVIERATEVKPSSKAMMHLYAYRGGKDIRTVVHTHARYSAAFSIMNKPIISVVYECAYLDKTGTVPVVPYERAKTVDLARKVAGAMKEYDYCLMKSHGTITTDEDMDAASLKAQYVEEIAEMYYITLAAENGVELHAPPVKELQEWAYPKEIILQEDRKVKKIINAPEYYTDDMLRGIYIAHPDMVKYVEDDLRCYCTAKKEQGRVATTTGGGTGHLPLFLGYVGENLLDGCSADDVFQSPSSEQICNAIKEAEAGMGVLFLYGNYTGDIMSFDMVTEMLDMGDTRTTSTVGADDVFSNKDAQMCRGIAGIFFIYKRAGARAARMGTLEEVLATAEKAKENTRTAGFALTPCVVPGVGHPNFTLAEDEMALGMGIHGGPGVWNGPVKTADEPTKESVGEILADMSLNSGEEVCVLINDLGTTSREELYILSGNVRCLLEEKGVRVYRTSVGEYATGTEMAGAFISVCRMVDQEMKQWTNMSAHTPFYTQV